MSRNTVHPLSVQAPPRGSLDPYGIPHHRDALAVVSCTVAADAAPIHVYDKAQARIDLLGVGGQFGDEAEIVGYPRDIDV
ncbi:hypothetical protein J1614_010428 [Plenodomus biglobosus]|nr:hypothetical protein J1614_010428 [Plenodomus biglobosus]